MYVSSLTELYTPSQTLSFSTKSKKQHFLLISYKAELCVLAHIDCYYCNSQYGPEQRVQSSNWCKQRVFLTNDAKT